MVQFIEKCWENISAFVFLTITKNISAATANEKMKLKKVA